MASMHPWYYWLTYLSHSPFSKFCGKSLIQYVFHFLFLFLMIMWRQHFDPHISISSLKFSWVRLPELQLVAVAVVDTHGLLIYVIFSCLVPRFFSFAFHFCHCFLVVYLLVNSQILLACCSLFLFLGRLGPIFLLASFCLRLALVL